MLEQILQEAGERDWPAGTGLLRGYLPEESELEAGEEEEADESCHPMIISQINNPRYNHLALLRIRNAASELRQTQLDLLDFLDDQTRLHDQFMADLAEELVAAVARAGGQTRGVDGRALEEAQRREEKLLLENQLLQERIFDMEQRMVGVELEVERRVKEQGRQAVRQAAAAAREESREVLVQLEAELAAAREKCKALEVSSQPSELREKEYQLAEAQAALVRREDALEEELAQLQTRKDAAYQCEHDLLAAEEALSRKTIELRRKEAELSEWEAELTRKSRALRTVREVTNYTQLPRQASREQLDRSGEVSLKSFGRLHQEEDGKLATTSLELLGVRRKPTLNNEEEIQSPRDPLLITRERIARHRQHTEARMEHTEPRREHTEARRDSRESRLEQVRSRLAPQGSRASSREASPYRALQDFKRSTNNSRHYPHPQASPREASSSRVSESRGRVPVESGLGSKLQRLREQIKKEIESIK